MDPLRDPMGVLLTLDKHLLSVSQGCNVVEEIKWLRWFVDLIEGDSLVIHHREGGNAYQCGLLELPNWAYSYALSLFLLKSAYNLTEGEVSDIDKECNNRADSALKDAMRRYPMVVELLLKHLETDIRGRSFRRDWVTVLDAARDFGRQLARKWYSATSDTIAISATMQTCDLVIQIFVQQNASLWGQDDVLQWVYDNLKDLVAFPCSVDDMPLCPSPAITRYADTDPAKYETKIQTLPPDAAPLDPGLVAQAMIINPNRGRLIRNNNPALRGQPGEQNGAMMMDADGNLVPVRRDRQWLGPPSSHVDPDWPLFEVFWRSFLPWNRVDGVPPPRR